MLKTPTTPPSSVSRDQAAVGLVANQTSPATRQPQLAKQQSRSRLWVKSFVVAVLLIGAIAAVGAVLRRSAPKMVADTTMTHIIKRGDLQVTVTEKGTLESSNNVEVRSKVWGWKTVNWVIESGAVVQQGDLLVELDSSEMEKKVDDAKINFHNSRADMITAESNVTVADKSIDEYLLGTFVEERGAISQEIFDAEQAVTQAELSYNSAERMAAKGLIKPLQLKGERFKLESATQKLALKKTRLTALEDFKKVKQQEKMESDLRAAEARLDAAKARVDLSETNVRQHEEQLSYHTIVAPQDGMVIHPKAAAHRDAPDVEEVPTCTPIKSC